MGASQSQISVMPQIARMEATPPASPGPHGPPAKTTMHDPPPQLYRVETLSDKFIRKVSFPWEDRLCILAPCCLPPRNLTLIGYSVIFVSQVSSQPLVPIGCIATAYFLVSGIKSFKDRDPVRSQKMMRARVGAQLVTLVIFMGYLGYEQLDFRLAPAYQDKKKNDEKLATEQEQEKQQS